jgi:maltose-binding protein MalE
MSKNMSRRQFLTRALALGGGLAAASALAACAPQSAPAPAAATTAPKAAATTAPTTAAAAPASAAKITLRVTSAGAADLPLLNGFITAYTAQNPNITFEVLEAGQLDDKTPLAVASGTLADVLAQVHNRWLSMWAYKGYYKAIDDTIAANPTIIPEMNDIYPIGLEAGKFEGKMYGIPRACWAGSALGVLMNRPLFEAAGVEVPKGEIELYALQALAMKVAKPKDGIWGIQMVTHKQNRIANTLRFYGKPEYGEKGDTTSWPSSPDGKKWRWSDNQYADEWYNKWYRPLLEAGAAVKPQEEPDAAGQGQLFVLGKVAMLQGYHRDPQTKWLAIGDKWKFNREDAVLIKGPQGRYGTCQESYHECIGVQTKQPVEALKFIGFYTNLQNTLKALDANGFQCARHRGYTETPLAKIVPFYLAVDKLLQSGSVEPYTLPWNFRDDEARDKYYNTTLPLFNITKTWKEQAAASQAEVQKVYDQPRP